MANIRVLNTVCDDKMRNLIIHAAHVKNLKSSEIAEFCLVSKRTVDRILQRFRETGETNKKQRAGYKPKL